MIVFKTLFKVFLALFVVLMLAVCIDIASGTMSFFDGDVTPHGFLAWSFVGTILLAVGALVAAVLALVFGVVLPIVFLAVAGALVIGFGAVLFALGGALAAALAPQLLLILGCALLFRALTRRSTAKTS